MTYYYSFYKCEHVKITIEKNWHVSMKLVYLTNKIIQVYRYRLFHLSSRFKCYMWILYWDNTKKKWYHICLAIKEIGCW